MALRWWKLVTIMVMAVLILGACEGDSSPSEPSDQEASSQGAALYEENCASCHGGKSGGAISDSPPPHNTNGHTWHHADCLLVDITMRSAAAWGGDPASSAMPAFDGKLSEQEVLAVIDYVKTWWTDDQRAYQSEVTQANCR